MQTEANEKEVEEALAKIRPDEAAMGSKKIVSIVERIKSSAGETFVEGEQGPAKRVKKETTTFKVEGEDEIVLDNLKVDQLKEMCKGFGIRVTGKRKDELIQALKDHQAAA
mmetsp:Transcript_16321/g.54660  ORF Transcript_16321/g.54660 Transcript_16321/m.54660 type:complete len:111 (-) Transcript_16321:161-493(-)